MNRHVLLIAVLIMLCPRVFGEAPQIFSIHPEEGPQEGGTHVTITGEHFGDDPGDVAVQIGGNDVTNLVLVSDTEITCTTAPSAIGPADVTVTTSEGTGTLEDGFAYVVVGCLHSAILGVVKDVVTREPIGGVTVTATPGPGTAISESQGRYVISNLIAAMWYTVEASAQGYIGRREQIFLPCGTTVEVNVQLTPSAPGVFGDVNGDGQANALDVQLAINGALCIPSSYDCDVNLDGFVNALDVQLVINAALGIEN